MPTPTTLETLRDHLTAGTDWPDAPRAHGATDWTELPTFGGTEPRDTAGVWSWDETRLLVGTCADDLRIVDRDGR